MNSLVLVFAAFAVAYTQAGLIGTQVGLLAARAGLFGARTDRVRGPPAIIAPTFGLTGISGPALRLARLGISPDLAAPSEELSEVSVPPAVVASGLAAVPIPSYGLGRIAEAELKMSQFGASGELGGFAPATNNAAGVRFASMIAPAIPIPSFGLSRLIGLASNAVLAGPLYAGVVSNPAVITTPSATIIEPGTASSVAAGRITAALLKPGKEVP